MEQTKFSVRQQHENSGVDKEINQPPYAEQAVIISFLDRNEIINTVNTIDYAGGYGRLGFYCPSPMILNFKYLTLVFKPIIQADVSASQNYKAIKPS